MAMARIIIEDVTGEDVIIKCDVQRKDEYTKAEKLAMVIFEKLMASLNKETEDGDNTRIDS